MLIITREEKEELQNALEQGRVTQNRTLDSVRDRIMSRRKKSSKQDTLTTSEVQIYNALDLQNKAHKDKSKIYIVEEEHTIVDILKKEGLLAVGTYGGIHRTVHKLENDNVKRLFLRKEIFILLKNNGNARKRARHFKQKYNEYYTTVLQQNDRYSNRGKANIQHEFFKIESFNIESFVSREKNEYHKLKQQQILKHTQEKLQQIEEQTALCHHATKGIIQEIKQTEQEIQKLKQYIKEMLE